MVRNDLKIRREQSTFSEAAREMREALHSQRVSRGYGRHNLGIGTKKALFEGLSSAGELLAVFPSCCCFSGPVQV